MTTTIGGTTGITFPDATTQNTSPYTGGLAFRNRIINGAMMIDQRNAGASVTPTSTGFTLDRWQASLSVASKYSVQRSTTAPVGFSNSLLVTSASAYTVGAGEIFDVRQKIEGFNVADLAWGTANAQSVTLSFQVRSSLTGTFGGALMNADGSRCYPFSYTISSAGSFETKSVTIAGCTDGTWNTDNSAGIQVCFGLGVGSTYSGTAGAWATSLKVSATGATSVVGTNGATFYITGVQLEKGSTATSFDYRPYGTELALCQRYYQILRGQNILANGSRFNTEMYFAIPFKTTMRTAATISYNSGTNYFRNYCAGSSENITTLAGTQGISNATDIAGVYSAITVGANGQAGWIQLTADAAYVSFSAEL